MPKEVVFPYHTPSTRVYEPGEYPIKLFESQNGATSAIRFGNRRSKSKLKLEFANVEEQVAFDILRVYRNCMLNWGYIRFNRGDDGVNGKGGSWEGVEHPELISDFYQENAVTASGTYWRFEKPPQVTSVVPGIVTVSCAFVSYLDGV